MPYTLLAANFTKESDFKSMSMTDPPGRGYRYYKGPSTIVPFGFGLSLTTFALKFEEGEGDAEAGAPIEALLPQSVSARHRHHQMSGVMHGDDQHVATVRCVVTNTGAVAG